MWTDTDALVSPGIPADAAAIAGCHSAIAVHKVLAALAESAKEHPAQLVGDIAGGGQFVLGALQQLTLAVGLGRPLGPGIPRAVEEGEQFFGGVLCVRADRCADVLEGGDV